MIEVSPAAAVEAMTEVEDEEAMKLFAPGDRVVVNPVQHCNACYACASGHTNLCASLFVPGVTANGGFAEK
mgnify:CR=1 FL=1